MTSPSFLRRLGFVRSLEQLLDWKMQRRWDSRRSRFRPRLEPLEVRTVPTIHRSALFVEQPALTTTSDGAMGVAVADLDRDGDLDIVAVSAQDDTVAWYRNNGGAFGPRQVISTAA